MPRKRRSPESRNPVAKKRNRSNNLQSGLNTALKSNALHLVAEPDPHYPSHEGDRPRFVDDEVGAGRSYFESHKGVVKTSNLTLANLNVAHASKLAAASASLKDPFALEQKRLESQIQYRFRQFLFMMSADHSLLFYGFGSKRALLEQLAVFLRDSYSVVVVNGFNPTVSVRTVLGQIASDILNLTDYPKRTLLDYVRAIRNGMQRSSIAIVVHNIDGPSFRAAEAQYALSMLATVQGVSIIASIDHVNAPLLWDGATFSRYDWAWIKADTFKFYSAETMFCSKPLLRGGKERCVEGAIALLKSLSEKACNIFRELAKKQTGRDTTSTLSAADRITFNQLFEIAKSKFLASDPTTLRIILTELETHDLLQRRRGTDMAEQLWIPLEQSQLREVLTHIAS